MSNDRTRRLSLDLLALDLNDRAALVAFVAAHAVAPARTLLGMDRLHPGEGEITRSRSLTFNALDMRPMWPNETHPIAEVEAFMRGFLLARFLFPGAIDSQFVHADFIDLPGSSVFERAFPLSWLRWPALEVLVDGLYGVGPGRPDEPTISRHYVPSQSSLGQLAEAQALVRSALGEPDDFAARVDIGLQAMSHSAAMSLDAVLRRDSRTRLVWLLDTEWVFDSDGPDPGEAIPLDVDRGVFAAVIPESLLGLVALDFVETLRMDPRTGKCAQCGQPVVLTPQQASRARKGEPIYHEDCGAEHRVRYVRDCQRRRRQNAAPNLTPSHG